MRTGNNQSEFVSNNNLNLIKETRRSILRSEKKRIILGAALTAMGVFAGRSMGQATPLYWDAGTTGTGTWLNPNAWNTGTINSVGNAAWASGDQAVFSNPNVSIGTVYTVTLGTVSADSVIFSSTAPVNFSGGALTLTGTAGITMNSGVGAVNIASAVTLGSSQTWSNNATTSLFVTGVVSGSGDALTTNSTGAIFLDGTNTFSGGLNINAGSVFLGVDGSQGTGAITLGATGSTANAALYVQGTGSTASGNYTNSITVLGGGTNTLGATSYNPVYTGGITLGNGSTSANLTIYSNNAAGSTIGVSGGISGSGNLTVAVSNEGSSKTSTITFSGGAVNPFGNITNNGTNDVTAADSGVVFNAMIGQNVGTVTQNSTVSPLTLNNANNNFGGLNISAGTVYIGAAGSLGNGTVTLGTGSAAASLIFNGSLIANSATFGSSVTALGSNTNTLGVINYGLTWNGAITLGNGASAPSNITLSTVNANGSTLAVAGGVTGYGNVTFTSSNQAGTGLSNVTISGNSINPVGNVTNNGTADAVAGDATVTVTATIGSNVGYVTQTSTVSPLVLNAANSFTGGLNVSAGTVNLGTVGAQGNGTITIGAASSASAASLFVNGTSTAANGIYAGNISVLGTGTATLGVLGYNPVFSGTVTLANSLNVVSNDIYGSVIGITGGITGSGNLTFNVSNEANTGISGVTVSGGTINPIGSISNIGANNNTPADSGVLISANIGSNVTSVTQNSATSPLTLSGSNTFTGPVTVSAGILDLDIPASLYNGTTSSWTTTSLVVKPGATLAVDVGGAGEFTASTINALLGVANATGGFMNASNIGFNTNAGNFTWSTPITNTFSGANSLGVVKLGANTLLLNAASTYTGSTTINAGTLQLGVTNALPTTTTVVLGGGTLDVQGLSQTISALSVYPGTSSVITDSVGSGGTLIINGTTDLNFGSSTPVNNTVNMSGLSNFTFNEPGNVFNVGDNGTYATATNSSTTVMLGVTNKITAATFGAGTSSTNGQGIASGVLYLGQTNNINASTIIIGNVKQSDSVQFNTGLQANPSITIYGTAGVGSTAAMTVGTNNNFAAATYTDTFNTTGGTLNAHLSSLLIGNMADRFGTVTGSFIMGAGTLSVSGTMTVGQSGGTTATDPRNGIGIFQLTGGTASASTILLANNTATTGISNASGTVLFNSGTLLATTITQGVVPPAVLGTTAGGTNSINFTWADGTLGNITGTNLSVASGVPLTLTNIGNTSGTHTFDITTGQTGTISSAVVGTGSITKIDGGALTLSNTNTFIGNTTITGGSLAVNGSLLSTGSVNISSGGILAGTGSVGSVTLAAGGSIQPGATATDGSFGALTVNGLTDNGGSMRFDLGGASSDFINDTNASVPFNGAGGTVSLSLDSALTASPYTILTAAGGIVGALPTLTTPVISHTTFMLFQSGNSLEVYATGTTANLLWDDIGTGNGITWDAVQSQQNWNNSGVADTFFNADSVTFSDINAGNNTVTITGQVLPGSVMFTNNNVNYTFNGSGGIGGVTGLTLSGTGSVTLLTSNTYTGPTNINSGALILGTGGSIAGTSANVNGGTLNVSGGTVASTALDIEGGTATINSGLVSSPNINVDSGSLTVAAGGSITASGVLVSVAGGASLTVASGGTIPSSTVLTDNGTVTFSNPTTTLASLTGTGVVNLNGDTLTITGVNTVPTTLADGASPGSLNQISGNLTLTGSDTYSGTTNLSAGAVVQIGNGGTGGSLNPASVITNNGQLIYNLTSNPTIANPITNNGSLNFTTTGAYFVNSTISGAGPISQNGGTLVLAGNISAFTGPFNLSNGALTFNYPAVGVTTTIANPVNIVASSTINNTGKLILTGTETLGTQTLTFNVSPQSGVLSDGVPADVEVIASVNRTSGNGLIKTGTGVLALSGTTDNAALGAIVNQGTLLLNKTGTNPLEHAIGGAPLNISSGAFVQITGTGGDQIYNGSGGGTVTVSGQFDLNGNSEGINALTLAGGTVANTLTNSTSVLTIGYTATSGIFQVTGGSGSLYAASNASLGIYSYGPGPAAGASQILNITGPGTVALTGTTDNVNMTADVQDGTLVLGKTASNTGAHAVNTITGVSVGATVQLSGTGGDQIYDGYSGGTNDDWGVLNMNGTFDLNGLSEGFDKLTGSGNVINSQPATQSTMTLGTNNLIGPTLPVFSGTITGNILLQLDVTNGSTVPMTLSGSNGYTAGTNILGGVLQIGNAGTTGTLGGGTVAISTPGVLQFNRSDSALVVSNNITGNGVVNQVGTGGTTLSGLNSYIGGTNVASGTLTFASPHAFPAFTNLTINSGAAAVAAAHTTGLTGASKNNLFVSNLSIAGSTNAWTGQLDLANNDMVVQNGNLSQINNQVAQGYNGGNWNGPGGIVSTAAATTLSHLTALGVIQNSVDGTTTGATLYSSSNPFDGATQSASSDVLVKYTYYGDTDLNGSVDGTDYSRIDYAYVYNQNPANIGSPLSGWFNGDFNYDGAVDGSDYTLMDNAFNSQTAVLSSQIATATAQIAGSAVPEPTTLSLLGIGAIGLLGRRRNRGRRQH